MVEIRRSRLNNNNKRNPFAGSSVGSGKSSSSSSATVLAIRVIIIVIIAIQGVRMFMSSSSSSSSSSTPSGTSSGNGSSIVQPLGLGERLQDSKQHPGNIRKPQQQQQSTIKHPPQPPPVDPIEVNSEDEEKNDGGGSDADADSDNEANDDEDEKENNDSNDENEDPAVEDHDEGQDHDDEAPQQHKTNSAAAGAGGLASPTSGAEKNPIVVEKKGTGPTEVGYVKDFVHERSNPVHRTKKVELKDVTKDVATLVHEDSVTPCETLEGDYLTTTVQVNPKCLDSDTPLIAYNPETFPRTWCGQNIPPGSAVTMTEHCSDPIVHLFLNVDDEGAVPPVSGEHMPPIIIKTNRESLAKDLTLESVECNISCRIEKGMRHTGGDLYIDGEESWTITQTLADGYYDASAKIERTDFMKDRYYSTQWFKSDIPLTHYDFGQYNLRDRTPVDFDTAKPAAIYLADSNCAASATKRLKYFGSLKEVITVDSYGSCGHNKDVPDGINLELLDDRLVLMREYRFVLALDTASSKDHISPIVWEALISGAVPIVVGADNIRAHLPEKSFISRLDFSHWDELSEYVKKVMDDKELWQSYHAWREDENAIAAVETKYAFSKTSPSCRLCRWAYAKKYGLGWDHEQQQVRGVSKVQKEKFCTTADNGLVSKPFSEEWIFRNGDTETVLKEDSVHEACSSLNSSGDIDVGSFNCHRTVARHDGVIDIFISEIKNDSSEGGAVLRLSFPGIRNPDGASFMDTHTTIATIKGPLVSSATIQDDMVKISVLADWNTSIVGVEEGIIEVAVNADTNDRTRRIRIIMEEMNAVHDKLTEFYPSSFYLRTAKDFIDPLPIFFANS
jgi:Glycosyltransferase family 10 (fucosyltransferase) C-term